MRRFFDSSALVKRYTPETGTAWVRSTLRGTPGWDSYIAYVTGPEIMAAFACRLRMGDITPETYLDFVTLDRDPVVAQLSKLALD